MNKKGNDWRKNLIKNEKQFDFVIYITCGTIDIDAETSSA